MGILHFLAALVFLTCFHLRLAIEDPDDMLVYMSNRKNQAKANAVQSGGKCEVIKKKTGSMKSMEEIHDMEWYETPSITSLKQDTYQAISRVVHMDYVQEYLKTKLNVDFSISQDSPNNILLDVFGDTIYIKGKIEMHGIKKLRMFCRKVYFSNDSMLDLSAPRITQNYRILSAGDDGDDGKDGVEGPNVEIFANQAFGNIDIDISGGDGNPGQNGKDGRKGADSQHKQRNRNSGECRSQLSYRCHSLYGLRGIRGGQGQDGGSCGKSGNGGDAGSFTLSTLTDIQGNIQIKSCAGKGGAAAKNGKGGRGGAGGAGGAGIKCEKYTRFFGRFSSRTDCVSRGSYSFGSRGATGPSGRDGQGLARPGSPGQKGTINYEKRLDRTAMNGYPLNLLKVMTRLAEDTVWANDLKKAEEVLSFVVTLTEQRADAVEYRKFAKRRMSFFNKAGYDRFGRDLLSAPKMKWEIYKKELLQIRDYARDYEDAFNGIKSRIVEKQGIRQILEALPMSTEIAVKKQEERLIEARRISLTEKGAYVPAIKEFESMMDGYLTNIIADANSLHSSSRFTSADLFAVLQGITGFLSAGAGKNPLGAASTAIGLAQHFATRCNVGGFQNMLGHIKKWMTFGQAYRALQDSSELDFDKIDVGAVPEMMKASFDMNKEGLAADLVCILQGSLPEHDSRLAKFKELIERFFIAGSARIDLIAKVIDLDNEIGGYNFDIENLRQAKNELERLRQTSKSPIADTIQNTFLDDLLTAYQTMEKRFTEQLYQVYKAFEYRLLWNVTDKLPVFEKTASEVAHGTGLLHGVLKLNDAIQALNNIEKQGSECFTNMEYSTILQKWSFNDSQHAAMFEDLHTGKASFSLDIKDSCKTCFNARLLKMYVEVSGKSASNIPVNLHLNLRRMGTTYYRNGAGQIKEFHQIMSSGKILEFNRLGVTNDLTCDQYTSVGKSHSDFCMKPDDVRLQPMCCHFLSDSKCTDKFLGYRECQSPFGSYTIEIPIDKNTPCQRHGSKIAYKNCKALDPSIYKKMNVWALILYWPNKYPTGPEDPNCFMDLPFKKK